ncbi:MAG: amidase [Halobacteriales archaeon]|nr:amidase [Halobacteriales archaeon]
MKVCKSAVQIAKDVAERKTSPTEVIESTLARIEKINPKINAFITILEDESRESARVLENRIERGEAIGPCVGVPVAVKDLFAFKKGIVHTFGSVPFSNYIPDRDAPLVERLERAGSIVVGKTNTPEFGHKGITYNEIIGRTANPFDIEVTPGGSSGGSAAAVASGMVPWAQGSDHAGSIRGPACMCNLYGHFPSVGRVPHAMRPDAFKYHLPFAASGPLTRTVEDAAMMLDVIAGPHPEDPDSLPVFEGEYVSAVGKGVEGMKVGYDRTFLDKPIEEDVVQKIEDALEGLEEAGAEIVYTEIEFSEWEKLHEVLMIGLEIVYAETAHNLKISTGIDLMEHQSVVSPVIIDRIQSGERKGVLEYRLANNLRTEFYVSLSRLLDSVDVLATPTMAVPPHPDAEIPTEIGGVSIPMKHGTSLTWPFNLTGNPVASIPSGLTKNGLPTGIQIVGPRFRDDIVLAVAGALEETRPWIQNYPKW